MKPLNRIIKCAYKTMISGIKTDSRTVSKGDLFIASKGFFVDHNMYIEDAIKNGAKAVITDIDLKADVPIIKRKNIQKALQTACINFYDYHNDINLFGVTGTDGKTTTAYILGELLNYDSNTAYMGTNGIKYKNRTNKTDNTTPPLEKLYQYLSELKNEGCKNCVMEVSSEALLHRRVSSLRFKYAIYTNITEDHLNIHKNINNYINSKIRLTKLLRNDGIIVSNGDDIVQEKIRKIKTHKVYTYGKSSDCDFQIKDIKEEKDRTTFKINVENEAYKIESPFLGEYNVYNLTAAFVVCYLERMDISKVINQIEDLAPIPGRGEILNFTRKYKIILDYAHTYYSIKCLINSYKKRKERIIVVTGAAGGREIEKRAKIGKFLLENCDLVIFTMDDPRFEDVNRIIDDMISQSPNKNYLRIIDRKEAIRKAFTIGQEGDNILIIGKGRDNYMAIKDYHEKYSDYEVIKSYFMD